MQGSCYRTYFDSKHFTSAYNVFEIALKLFQCAKTIWMKKQNYINSKYENSRCTSVHIHLAAIHYVPSCFGAASIDKIYIHYVIYMIQPSPSKIYKRNSINLKNDLHNCTILEITNRYVWNLIVNNNCIEYIWNIGHNQLLCTTIYALPIFGQRRVRSVVHFTLYSMTESCWVQLNDVH